MHALTARSPVIRFAKRTLLTAGTGLHDRAIPSWGARNGKDDKRKTLENAVVLCCSAAFGETTRKWNEILTKELLTIPFNETEAVDVLMKLLTVYESVSAVPAGAVVRNKQWSLSNFSPYIVWSIREFPGEFPRLLQGWKQFLAEVRGDPKKMEVLKADVGAARGWSTERWKRGYRRVFDPAGAAAEYGQIHGEDYDDESDDEY
jgi:hypothetical protein